MAEPVSSQDLLIVSQASAGTLGQRVGLALAPPRAKATHFAPHWNCRLTLHTVSNPWGKPAMSGVEAHLFTEEETEVQV